MSRLGELAGRVLPYGLMVYRDRADWWIGYFRGGAHHYVCPLPTLVIRWPRKHPTPRKRRSHR